MQAIPYPMSRLFRYIILPLLSGVLFSGCGNSSQGKEKDIAISSAELSGKVNEHIREYLQQLSSKQNPWDDSTTIGFATELDNYYRESEYKAIWSSAGKWQPVADSLYLFIERARYRGLYPENYHLPALQSIRQSVAEDAAEKTARMDAVLWAKADLLFSDAFFQLIHDLKLGRLPADSLTARKDTSLAPEFFTRRLSAARQNQSLSLAFYGLEPHHDGYRSLIDALPGFLENAFQREYTLVPSPKSGEPFRKALQTRLFEGGYLPHDSTTIDSVIVAEAVKKFQADNFLAVDGKAGDGTVRVLNTTDHDRFARIAITLDKYKHLPDTMPERFLWVNIPGFNMYLREGDSISLESKIICGKPGTRTPQLTSAISELITYPQWTVPASIIAGEILPAVKKDPGYLAKKGFSLIDSEGNVIDPYEVDWTKYSRGIPYKVVQGSGDDNALGILKFNFPNKYAVYLHDTNQRYLFAREMRSLSHGCVRVQAWDKLANKIIRYDHKPRPDGSPSPVEDSLNTWLKQKVKKHIAVKNRLPVFIRYFTAEARNKRIVFYDDIYGEDKMLQARFYRKS